MREYDFFDLKSETPTPRSQRINLSNSMVTHHDEDVNRITLRDIVMFIALVAVCWFFCFIDNNAIVGLVGMIASLAVLCIARGNDHDIY